VAPTAQPSNHQHNQLLNRTENKQSCFLNIKRLEDESAESAFVELHSHTSLTTDIYKLKIFFWSEEQEEEPMSFPLGVNVPATNRHLCPS